MPRPIVCIAGGGTAGLEALLSARAHLGDGAELCLIAPGREFRYRPLGRGAQLRPSAERGVTIAAAAAAVAATVVADRLAEVDEERRTLLTRDGDTLPFDYLLLAAGARGERTLRQGQVWERGHDPSFLDEALAGLANGRIARVGVVVPRGARWPVPAYELALVLAWTAGQERGRVTLVTAEERPLGALGARATELVLAELSAAGVELITGHEAFDDLSESAPLPSVPELRLLAERPDADSDPLTGWPSREHRQSGRAVTFDRLISLPTATGPGIAGVAHDVAGFVVVDGGLKVLDSERIWAAGSCVSAGLEHSALAAQQADASISAMAAAMGIEAETPLSVPHLTGILLSDQRQRWLDSNPPGTRQPSTRCLWWPPGRAVGQRLAQLIADDDPELHRMLPNAPRGVPVSVPVVLGERPPAGASDRSPESIRARQRNVANRQLLAVDRRERAAETELRAMEQRLRDFDTEQAQVVSRLRASGYLQHHGDPV